MAALIGRHINKIDKKGRVSVPKPFRNALSNQEFAGVYAYPSFKYPAIEACGEKFIHRIITSLDDLDLFSDDQDDVASTVLENTHQLSYDPEGRIILPPTLLKHADLGKEAVFVGRGNRFQVWEPAAYQQRNSNAFARARNRGVTLRLRTKEVGLRNDK